MAEPTSGAAQEDRRWARLEAQRKEAMRLEHEAVQELREIRNNRNLAICVGSGVTLFSTRNDDGTIRDRLTWKGLIHNGFDYLQREEPRFYSDNKKTFDSARDILDNTDSTLEDVLHAARTLTRWMETKHKFADWLSTQFERLNEYVKYPAILVSLAKLHRAGAALMTTNYDGLIEHHCQLTALDGSQSGELELFNRRKVPNVVFHPHGYWKTPKYIVLDSLQYYDVGRVDNAVRKVLEDMLRGRTVVFVGCGAGVGDPNFGQLLQWLGKQQKDVSHGHYILLRKGDDYAELEGLPLKKVHVATFDDIAKWLEDLLVDPSERSDGTEIELASRADRPITSTLPLVQRLNGDMVQQSQQSQQRHQQGAQNSAPRLGIVTVTRVDEALATNRAQFIYDLRSTIDKVLVDPAEFRRDEQLKREMETFCKNWHLDFEWSSAQWISGTYGGFRVGVPFEHDGDLTADRIMRLGFYRAHVAAICNAEHQLNRMHTVDTLYAILGYIGLKN